MKQPIISAIAAFGARTRALGKDNKLIWDMPKDRKRYNKITTGHPLIMGRKTYESIGRPLPKRTNIVVTRNPDYKAPGCIVVHSLDEALEKARELDEEEIFINGGGFIYRDALPITDRLYLTLVDSDEEGDAFFPEYETEFTKEISREEGEENGIHYTYLTLEREH